MSTPNSWCPVEVANLIELDITSVHLSHRYDNDHHDERTWPTIAAGGVSDTLNVGFWTGFGRTGKDYWHISFTCGGATYSCKDNFYCFLTRHDVGHRVRVEVALDCMRIRCPASSSAEVSLQVTGFPTANRALGYYNIAHMVNTLPALDWAVQNGANAVEGDLQFDSTGAPTTFMHGFPADSFGYNHVIPFLTAAPTPLGGRANVCHLVGGDNSTPVVPWLAHVASMRAVALLIVDSKLTDSVNLAAAGANVIAHLEQHLFGAGYVGNVIVSTDKVRHADYLRSSAERARGSPYSARISFAFDGRDDYEQVAQTLRSITPRRVYGTGISAMSPATFYDQIRRSCVREHRGQVGLTYVWTLDSPDSMMRYLQAGARAIMTNMPGVCAEVLRANGMLLAAPQAPIPAATA